MGAQLCIRTTRELQMTEAGRLFYPQAKAMLAAEERARNSIADVSGAPAGVLRVSTPLAFGRRVLAPMLVTFQRENPKISVQVRSSDQHVDLLKENIDLAIRTVSPPDSSFITRKLADGPRVLCASPIYLAARGRPQTPAELKVHNCLLLRFPGCQEHRWTLGPRGAEEVIDVAGTLDSDDSEVLTRWALDGAGIVLKPYWEVVDHLKSGALERVLPNFRTEPADIRLILPSREAAPKTRALVEFLVASVTSNRHAFAPD